VKLGQQLTNLLAVKLFDSQGSVGLQLTIKSKSINIHLFSNSFFIIKMSDTTKTEDAGKAVGDAADTVAVKTGEAIAGTQKAVHEAVDPKSTSETVVDDVVKLTNDAAAAVVSTSQAAYDKVAGAGEEPKK
jgi:hypothetical protein